MQWWLLRLILPLRAPIISRKAGGSKALLWLFVFSLVLISLPSGAGNAAASSLTSGAGKSWNHPQVVSTGTPIPPVPTLPSVMQTHLASKACHICGDDRTEQPVVRAVLFWMATCGHCKVVLTEVLPPLEQQYQEQLVIVKIEVSSMEDFDRLYEIASLYGIPKNNVGVPFLVIGDKALIGSRQIPQELPGLIESYLAQGGVNFPTALIPLLPELQPYLSASTEAAETAKPPAGDTPPGLFTETPLATVSAGESLAGVTPAPEENLPVVTPGVAATLESGTPPQPALPQLPSGFILAVGVMILLVIALIWSVLVMFLRLLLPARTTRQPGAVLFLFLIIGLPVAGYLAYVELFSVQAVCGPVGDCNTVQQSPYARIFGFLPVGLLGVGAYLAMMLVWWAARTGGKTALLASAVLYGMSLFGVGFSIYLTYLELFVIRAVCVWCLTSAVTMALVLLAHPYSAVPKPE